MVRGPVRPRPADWAGRVRAVCSELRDAVLAVRDGAEVVATVHAFGLGARRPGEELTAVLLDAGCDPGLARVAAGTLLHFVFGHAADEQAQLQAGSAGAIADAPTDRSDFALGLDLVVDGIAVRLAALSASR
nr:TetR/AcrR family transcriptional regulator C-terminal domain-containing protein [Auraticoccus cholistanensis]